ncbi:MAG: hypothetical protein LBP38_04725 [Desulfovibrio sp.]|jgi:hypothetical protein|nr:hypothetical protein [Desulfovibrio sp.]
MTTRNKKIAAVLFGALLIAAGFFFVPSLLEKQMESRTAEFLKSLPGNVRAQSVKADFRNAEVVLKSVTGTGKHLDGEDFHFEAGEVLAGDVKSGSLSASGPVPLLGRFRVKDLKIRADITLPEPELPITQTFTVAELSLRDISGDLKRLMQAYGAGQDEFIDAVATYRIGNVDVNGYAVDSGLGSQGSARVTLDSFTGRDVSLTDTGPWELRGFKFAALSMDIASMKSMRAASGSIPNMYHYMTAVQQEQRRRSDGRAAIPVLAQALETAPVVLRGMECEDISLPLNFPAEKRIHIAGTSADVTLDARGFKARATLSGMSVPPALLSGLIPLASRFATAYGKNLRIEAVVDVDGTLEEKEGVLNLNTFSLADPALASLETSGAFAFTVKEGKERGLEGLLLSGADLFLKNCRLTIEDINLVDNLLAGGGDKAVTRTAIAAAMQGRLGELLNEGEHSGLFTRAVRGLAQLVAAPGKLTVTVNPALPLPLTSNIIDGEEMDRLEAGATVEYIPR